MAKLQGGYGAVNRVCRPGLDCAREARDALLEDVRGRGEREADEACGARAERLPRGDGDPVLDHERAGEGIRVLGRPADVRQDVEGAARLGDEQTRLPQ